MKIDFKGITAEDLSFKLNRVRLNPEDKLDIKPQFSRQVRRVNGNDKLQFVALSVKIESTEVEDMKSSAEERSFVIEATKLVYPYLRACVTNLTANAFIAPLNLPVIDGPIFPEDRDNYAFTTDGGAN